MLVMRCGSTQVNKGINKQQWSLIMEGFPVIVLLQDHPFEPSSELKMAGIPFAESFT